MENISTLKKSFKRYVALAKEKNFYLDCNYYDLKTRKTIADTTSIRIEKDDDRGIKFRIWTGSNFIEKGTSSLNSKENEKIILELLEKAEKLRKENEENIKLKVDTKILQKDFTKKFKLNSLKFITEKLQNIKARIKKVDKDIIEVKAGIFDEFERHLFVSEKKCLYQEIPIYVLLIIVYVKANNSIRDVFTSVVDDDLENIFKKLEKVEKKFEKEIKEKKSSEKIKGGTYEVILSPKISGLLAHESFGHGMEADTFMKNRALAKNFIGKKICSENINIVDFPNIPKKNGFFNFDFEGNEAKKTYLVRKGIVCDLISDLYSKTKLNLKNSSNSRFETFDHKNYVRMSNTYFEPGKETFENMIKNIKNGIYIKDTSGGMEDPKSWGVQIQGCFGQQIKDGKLIPKFYDGFTITGFYQRL